MCEKLPINRIIINKPEFKRWVDDVRKEDGLSQSEVLEKAGIVANNPSLTIKEITFENSIKVANALGYQILMVPKD